MSGLSLDFKRALEDFAAKSPEHAVFLEPILDDTGVFLTKVAVSRMVKCTGMTRESVKELLNELRNHLKERELMTSDPCREAFESVQSIRGWFSNLDQARKMWQANNDARHSIEIGTYCGKSAIFQALARKFHGVTGVVYCVDTFKATNTELQDEDTLQEFMQNVEAFGVADYVKTVVADSRNPETREKIPQGAALVYIDGGHQYNEVMGDIQAWRKHVGKSGLLMFHDYYRQPGEFAAVYRAINDARARNLIGQIHRILPDTAYCVRANCNCDGWR